ncbi:3-phosphoshikimate 1-carboxyvinyltransferase [Vulcanisaeta thermophila]|uniref:3-phosphoshikimate 1-carboxyvinyltransferase n=1 Tax=Vulcanisaeta thermophila TaxID=867917 RepID=UPI000853D9B8|nr:3-phosphoshikimate 1-carboxyvinyltransferase [Vulcanisaeta thermophila]
MGKLVTRGFELRRREIKAPPSKAFTLRYLLASGLSKSWVTIKGLNWGSDTWAMVNGIKPISDLEIRRDLVRVRRAIDAEPLRVVDVGESGFTLRTLTGVYSGIKGMTYLIPRGSLTTRPMEPLITALRGLGVDVESVGGVVRVRGGELSGGYVSLSGSVSSQFISSLMYLAPLTTGGIEISIRPPIKSKPYIDATAKVLREFGINVEINGNTVFINGAQEFRPPSTEIVIPGDYALAAFYMVLAVLLGFDLEINGLSREYAVEGEYSFINYAREMGVEFLEHGDKVLVLGSRTSELKSVSVDLSDSPDIAMPLALLMARARGTSRITGIEHLAHKESNRLRSMAQVLKCVGANVSVNEEVGVLEINGVGEFRGGCEVGSQGDHRIVMMATIAGLASREPITVVNWEDVLKSWTTFPWDLQELGARIELTN